MTRQSELGVIPSAAIGCALGVVICVLAWIDAAVFRWGVGKPFWSSFLALPASLGLILVAAWLSARIARSLKPNRWALAVPMVLAVVGSYVYVAINMTILNAKGGIIFAIIFVVTMQEPGRRERDVG